MQRKLAALALIPALLAGCSTGSGDPITFFSLLPPSSFDLAAPANLPPEGYDSEFWVDKRGCTYVRTGSGDWVPQLNVDRSRKCDRSLAWEPVDPGPQPTSIPVPSETVDPATGIVTRVLPPKPIPPSFVQVAVIEDRTNGLATRQRFIDLGFPVVGADQTPPEGTGITIVLGPFTEAGLLGDGLNTARQMGFPDAFSFQN